MHGLNRYHEREQLKEELCLICHDLQKTWECTKEVEGRIGDVYNKSLPEKLESRNLMEFIEQWLVEVFGK